MKESYKLIRVNKRHCKKVKDLANKVTFLCRVTWKRPVDEMVSDRAKGKKYQSFGFMDKDKLISYIDYRVDDNVVKIGFCITDPDYQRQGLMSTLVDYVLSEHSDKSFVIETYEGNSSMISLIEKYNFKLKGKKKDRVDDTNTLRYFLKKN